MRSIDLVIPIYNEERNVDRLSKVLETVFAGESSYRWRVVFVNDGSKDASLDHLKKLAAEHTHYQVIDLSRNYGKEIALSCGLDCADGDAVICMDADLQHPPEFIPQLVRAWESGFDIVATVRKQIDKQPILRKVGSRLFYYLMARLSDLDMTSQTTDFRLIDHKVVVEFRKIKEKKRMFRALIDWLGYRKTYLEFSAPHREGGVTSFSYRKLWNLAFDSFISYSSFPLRLVGYIGVVITSLSAGLLSWMAISHIYWPDWFNFTPLAMVMVSNTLLMGIVLIALGFMSMYINKVYAEIIHRPLYAIREWINPPSSPRQP